MAKLNATDVAASWSKGMTSSIEKVKRGVMAVTESPMAKAAAAQDRYLAGVQRAVDDGRYVDGLQSVTLADWQKVTAEKASRITQGVKEAESKMVSFMQQLLPYTDNVSREVQNMPKGTLADSIQRATRTIELMAQFRFRKKKV